MRNIEWEAEPAKYDLGVGNKALLVGIHPVAYQHVLSILSKPEIPLVKSLQSIEGVNQFISPSEDRQDWGFGSVFHQLTIGQDSWSIWECDLPKAEFSQQYQKLLPNWPLAFSVSASLNALFTTLSIFDEEISSDCKQLVGVDLRTDKGMHGGSLSVALSGDFVKWIATKVDNYSDKQTEILMDQTYQLMTGRQNEDLTFRHCQVLFRQPQWVNLSCPGDACGLDPGDYHVKSHQEGYSLYPHNVDSPVQQLTLLMGIASLHDQVRQK